VQPTALEASTSRPWWQGCRWTLGLCAAMTVLNLGLVSGTPPLVGQLVDLLQLDRRAVLDGQLWRLVTGNLVHWSREHFLLDVGAFALVGLLYERRLGRHYPWLLLAAGLAVGGGVFLFLPEMSVYRGLSGVDSGQFAAALCAEVALARREGRRWLWIAPAAGVFLLKILSECATGEMFFGTESLGDIGDPVPLAHAAGAAAAVLFLAGAAALRMPDCRRDDSDLLAPSDARTIGALQE